MDDPSMPGGGGGSGFDDPSMPGGGGFQDDFFAGGGTYEDDFFRYDAGEIVLRMPCLSLAQLAMCCLLSCHACWVVVPPLASPPFHQST